jgi:hypothetical protein
VRPCHTPHDLQALLGEVARDRGRIGAEQAADLGGDEREDHLRRRARRHRGRDPPQGRVLLGQPALVALEPGGVAGQPGEPGAAGEDDRPDDGEERYDDEQLAHEVALHRLAVVEQRRCVHGGGRRPVADEGPWRKEHRGVHDDDPDRRVRRRRRAAGQRLQHRDGHDHEAGRDVEEQARCTLPADEQQQRRAPPARERRGDDDRPDGLDPLARHRERHDQRDRAAEPDRAADPPGERALIGRRQPLGSVRRYISCQLPHDV